MGFDVYAQDGEGYFRANIWSWPGILKVIALTEVLPQELVTKMGYNSGAKVSATRAKKLAEAMEKVLEGQYDNQKIVTTGSNCAGTALGLEFLRMATNGEVEEIPDVGEICAPGLTQNGLEIDVGFVREFIRFCRNSGGFEVW